MRNCTGNFLRRLLLLSFLGALVSGCAIVPEPVTVTPIAFTPVFVPTSDPIQGHSKPFWELTATPDPNRATAVSELVQTALPLEELATADPGQELIAYLPRLTDLPQCQSLDYVIQTTNARAVCNIIPQGSISVTIMASPTPYTANSLSLPTAYQAVDHDTIGQASVAGTSERGDGVTVLFIKKQIKVFLSYSTPNQVADPETVLKIARLVERNVPESSPPPLTLSFPDNQQLERKAAYFSAIQLSLITNGRYHFSSDFKQGDQICVYIAPLKTAYDELWTIVLYDLQKNQVVKKMMRGMYAQNVCSGLEPEYPKDSYKTGDQYEIRIAVNEEWVATFPLVTR